MADRCPNCDSVRILPMVFGSPNDAMMELSVQGLVALGGCHGAGPGSALWQCSDCGHSLTDSEHLYSDDPNSEGMRRYHATIERIFNARHPLSDEQYDSLQGRETLHAMILQSFQKEASAADIVATRSGFELHLHINRQTDVVQHEIFSARRFSLMSRFVRDELAAVGEDQMLMTVRIGKQDRSFVVALAPGDVNAMIRVHPA